MVIESGMQSKYIYFWVNMTKNSLFMIYTVGLLTRKCELVKLPLEVTYVLGN